MRIGIDARFFGPQETGIGRYVDRLIRHLERLDQRNDYVIFLRQSAWDRWQPSNPRWQKVLADHHWYTVSEQRFMPGIFRRAKLDLLHVPHFNVPVLYRGKRVVTIHDLILDHFPTERATTLEPFLFRAKFAAYQFVVRQAVYQSAALITVSENSKHDLMKRFHLPEKKITVTYESVDPMPNPVPFGQLQQRGVPARYILHVGNSYPHKNLERLLEAWKDVVRDHPDVTLVLVGKRDYFSKRLEEEAAAKGVTNVLWFGFASEAELAGLYQNAAAYVFPSLSEGFGLPGLEAMQAGIPVVASRATCLPEVFGSAAEYFNPHATTEMTKVITAVLDNQVLRQKLVAAGYERLKRFSWSTMAAQTLALYERL